MQKMQSLTKKLSKNHPNISFKPGDTFSWSPAEATVYYRESSDDLALLLHEASHALLEHSAYSKDVELLAIERDAWEKTREIAPVYGVHVDSGSIEEHLDSYRDWLHRRSTCPACGSNGIQTKQDTYRCLACDNLWRVNDARTCALRRYQL